MKIPSYTFGQEILWGGDPEFFFQDKNGNVVGAEKVMPKGIFYSSFAKPTVVLDGVQAEIQLPAVTCRQSMGSQLRDIFARVSEHLKTSKLPYTVCLNKAVVELTKEEHETLSPEARILGCAPSFNAYNRDANISVDDPSTYMFRSAGGHIHFGVSSLGIGLPQFRDRAETMAKVCDRIMGNTFVLIDRDPMAAKRREVYGRAGEFRIPPHGFEYRTLSNVWLYTYALQSLVGALAKFSTGLMVAEFNHGWHTYPEAGGAVEWLLSLVDDEAIQEAINTNNFDLAWDNYQKLKPVFEKNTSWMNGLNPSNLEHFEFFVQDLRKNGIQRWFGTDPMKNWLTNRNGKYAYHGWENFLHYNVRAEMQKARMSSSQAIEEAANKVLGRQ